MSRHNRQTDEQKNYRINVFWLEETLMKILAIYLELQPRNSPFPHIVYHSRTDRRKDK